MRISADLHCHVGSGDGDRLVKISADPRLTIADVILTARKRGLDMVGVVDCHSPAVCRDIERAISRGEMRPFPGGGLDADGLTVIAGSELQVSAAGRPVHVLTWYPWPRGADTVRRWLTEDGSNAMLGTPTLRSRSIAKLLEDARSAGWLTGLAHVFTPHRGLLGAVSRLADCGIDRSHVDAVELGLSADDRLASMVPDIASLPWLTCSDAHSRAAVGRESVAIEVGQPDLPGLTDAIRSGGAIEYRGVPAELGKYYRTACRTCGWIASTPPPCTSCDRCGDERVTMGVRDRAQALASGESARGEDRPPYRRVIPLNYLPGIGPKTETALMDRFGLASAVVYDVPLASIEREFGVGIAEVIKAVREGGCRIRPGGGGRHGKVILEHVPLPTDI